MAGLFRVSVLLSTLGIQKSREEIERVFSQVDDDEDDTLGFDEFLSMLRVYVSPA